jgi:3-O-methylgallate 3,4-dioxygenase
VASRGLSHQVIDEELDQRVVEGLTSGDFDALRGLPRKQLNGGPGTPEILNWITVASAMAPTNMELIDYQPCYRSVAGTGHGVAFGYWSK